MRCFWFFAAWLLLAGAARSQPLVLSGTFHASAGAPGQWDSRQDDGRGRGALRMGPIELRGSLLLRVAGQPDKPGIFLGWEDARTGERCPLGVIAPPDDEATLVRWSVPRDWSGRKVYLVAEDNTDDAWISVSRPLPSGVLWRPMLRVIAVHAWVFVLLLAPGLAWSVVLAQRRSGRPQADATLLEVMLGTAFVCYGIFLVYVVSAPLGRAASVGVAVASLAILSSRGNRARLAPLIAPLGYAFSVGAAYLGILLLYGGAELPASVGADRYVPYPADLLLPFQLSDVWYQHLPIHPFVGDWLTSDRPPLQAAMNLLVGPLVPREFAAESVGIVAQTFALLALWHVLSRAGATRRERCFVIGLATLSGFFLLNTTFTWPKLLPAGLLLGLFGELYFGPQLTPRWLGVLGALALLAHAGAAFGLAGIAVWVGFRRRTSFRRVWPAMAAACCCLLPWLLYQRFLDPPGDRLLKWHLAGDASVDPRPFGRVLLESYRAAGWSGFWAAKAANFAQLFRAVGSDALADAWRGVLMAIHGDVERGWAFGARALRLQEAYLFFPSFGPALVGIAGLLLPRRRAAPLDGFARAAAAACLVTLGLWCLLMFMPGSTINHQGSYFANLAGWLALGIGLTRLPVLVAGSAAALQVTIFLAAWVFLPAHGLGRIDLLPASQAPALLVALGGGIAAALTLRSQPVRSPPSRARGSAPHAAATSAAASGGL